MFTRVRVLCAGRNGNGRLSRKIELDARLSFDEWVSGPAAAILHPTPVPYIRTYRRHIEGGKKMEGSVEDSVEDSKDVDCQLSRVQRGPDNVDVDWDGKKPFSRLGSKPRRQIITSHQQEQ